MKAFAAICIGLAFCFPVQWTVAEDLPSILARPTPSASPTPAQTPARTTPSPTPQQTPPGKTSPTPSPIPVPIPIPMPQDQSCEEEAEGAFEFCMEQVKECFKNAKDKDARERCSISKIECETQNKQYLRIICPCSKDRELPEPTPEFCTDECQEEHLDCEINAEDARDKCKVKLAPEDATVPRDLCDDGYDRRLDACAFALEECYFPPNADDTPAPAEVPILPPTPMA